VNELEKMLGSSKQDVCLGHEEGRAILCKQLVICIKGSGPR
jgi:hypothetical protein